MSKRTKEEIEALWKKADVALANAPKMPEEDARRLLAKWKRDSASFNKDMVQK